jgi:hypothetical protein
MRRTWISRTAVVVCLAVIGSLTVAEPAAAGLTVSCVGAASEVTVAFDLFVPAGKSCDLTNVVINGSATVRAGANLFLTGSTVNGPLVVQSDGFVSATGSTVTGVTRLNAAFGALVDQGSRTANLVATHSGFLFGIGSSFAAVTSTDGETYLESARLTRDLSTTGDVLTDVYNSVIEGGVTVRGAAMGSVVCVSEIDGDAEFGGAGAGGAGADAILQIGASAPLEGCGFNVFGADLALTDNAVPTYVADNVIRGALRCTGNDPEPFVSGNRVRGGATDQCAPATTTAAAKSGPASGRRADLLARIASRTHTGESAAAAAGPATITG